MLSASELFTRLGTITVNEVAYGRTLFAFKVNLEEFERSIVTAADQKAIALYVEPCNWQHFVGRCCFPDVQVLAAKLCVRTGPGLKTADAIEKFGGAAGEIQQPIFFLENRCKSCQRTVLWARFNRARLQAVQSVDHEIGSDLREPRSERLGSVAVSDGHLALQKDVASVESGVDAHGGHAGDALSLCNCPLNRGGTAILREKRSMQIDVPERRQVEHPLRNDTAVADNDYDVRLEIGQLRAEFFVALDLIGLRDWQS